MPEAMRVGRLPTATATTGTRAVRPAPAKAGQKSPAAATGTPVAEIKFAADSTSLSDEDRQTLEKVVPLYQEHPGKVRIVGYAGAGGGAAEQLNSFRAALDRAQAVAAALTKAGIPADKIAVEAAPSGAIRAKAAPRCCSSAELIRVAAPYT